MTEAIFLRTVVIAQPTKRKALEPSPAWQLYQGSQQQLLQQGLKAVWERWGFRQLIDELILSPWHGPLQPEQIVAPYDYTWKGRPREEVAAQVRDDQVVERLRGLVQPFDLVVVLLSKVYLAPLQFPSWVPGCLPQRWLFFASREGAPYLPRSANARVREAGSVAARRAGVKVLDLKSYLFRDLCQAAAQRGAQALDEAWEGAEPLV